MFNGLIHSINIKRAVVPGSIALLLFMSQTCLATECAFGDGHGGTTTLINAEYKGGPIRLPSPGTAFNSVGNGVFNINLSPGIQADCNNGTNGNSLMSQTAPGLMVGSHSGNAIFATNIPGIGFTLRVHTAESDGGTGGYFSTNTTGWKDLTGGQPTENWDNKWINTSAQIFIGPEYKGNPDKVTVLTPKAGTIGQMGLGDPNDSDNRPWTFIVNESSFQIPIVLPTCDTVMLSNGGNDVDLGDYYVSDIKNNHIRDIPFAIQVSNCTSVATFTTKLTATNVTGASSDLLGNTLTSAAEGAGVKIVYDGTTQLIPNSAASAYALTDSAIPGSKEIGFTAQLVSNGSTVKPGSFKATGVFTLSYD